ncbi:MAG TPA: murein L,D-transpeptidase catalytic domain family protein [Flavisolibacter sp.]|nr:murein L,D-transpeptidase catalytic domain family protein [Flavisolibacter sp.]
MRKPLLFLLSALAAAWLLYYFWAGRNEAPLKPLPVPSTHENKPDVTIQKLRTQVSGLKDYLRKKRLSTTYCFMIDMSLPSGKKRFFVYDLLKDTVVMAGLVAHGSCNYTFLRKPQFSNTPNSGCSSKGKYKIGYAYKGRFGKAYKLFGLDSTNTNAFNRAVVLHAYDCVPDKEVAPQSICNSLGCPMISYAFRSYLEPIIDSSRRPVLLWIFE